MRQYIFLAIAISVAGLTPGLILSQPTAREVLETVDSLQMLVEHEFAIIEMHLFEGDREVRSRTLELTTANTDGLQKSLVVFTSPADIRGMSLLTIESPTETDQLLYLPALRRVQRIAGSQRQDRFAGSDFAFDDLRPRDPGLYENSTLVREPGIWIITMVPSEDGSAYSHIIATVDSAYIAVKEARYFDRNNQLKKILTSSNFSETMPGVWKPESMVMKDVQDNRRTELRYRERDTDRPIPAETFTERRLQRGS